MQKPVDAFPKSPLQALLLIAGGLLSGSCSGPPSLPVPKTGQSVLTVLIADHGYPASTSSTQVQSDPVYKREMRYQGIPFAEYLSHCGVDAQAQVQGTLVQFLCIDGYNPIAEL